MNQAVPVAIGGTAFAFGRGGVGGHGGFLSRMVDGAVEEARI